jgi:hypothetical protein
MLGNCFAAGAGEITIYQSYLSNLNTGEEQGILPRLYRPGPTRSLFNGRHLAAFCSEYLGPLLNNGQETLLYLVGRAKCGV